MKINTVTKTPTDTANIQDAQQKGMLSTLTLT